MRHSRSSFSGSYGHVIALALIACASVASAESCVDLRPVLFVHGSGLDSSTWTQMRWRFERAGYPVEWLSAPDLKPNNGSNRAAAQQVASAIDALLETAARRAKASKCRAPSKVDIVAHSMGVVSARWYISQIDASRVQNLVGIAAANHGSNALCGLQGDGNREMCPAFGQDKATHAVQVTLNGTKQHRIDETPFGPGADPAGVVSVRPDNARRVNYLMIYLDPDEWIVPSQSALLAGAGGLQAIDVGKMGKITSEGNLVWLDSIRHDDLPKDENLIAMLIATLKEHVAE